MQIRIFLSALNIDDIGKKWGVRIAFLLLTLGNFYLQMFPIGDSDISPLMNWYNDYFENPEMYLYTDISDIPISTGNIIFFIVTAVSLLVMIIVAVIYSASYIYDKRVDKKEVKKSLVVRRTIFMTLFIILIFPALLIFISGMSFVFVGIMPILSLVVCSYISGDFTFGASFGNAFRKIRRNYFGLLINFIIAFLIISFLQTGVDLFRASNAYFSIICVLSAALTTYTYLALGRLMGTVYLDVKANNGGRIVIGNIHKSE